MASPSSVRQDRRYDTDQDKHVVVGYEASHRVRVELSFDKELLDRVLGQVAWSASEAAVTVSFDVSDRDTLRRRAMRAAVADAQEAEEGVTIV
ncbi:MAG: SIMPL domain-containing protein [Rubrobacter sp.]